MAAQCELKSNCLHSPVTLTLVQMSICIRRHDQVCVFLTRSFKTPLLWCQDLTQECGNANSLFLQIAPDSSWLICYNTQALSLK